VQEYDKVRLVPFSEHVPYQDHVPFMQKKFLEEYLTFLDRPGVQWWSDFYPGDSMVLFETREAVFGVLICFESTFPEFCREYIRRGAHFIVGITNDTWFGTSVGIHMHSRIFVTRMVENRSWGVRVANSGLSYVVDPYGRTSHELPLMEAAVDVGRVGLPSDYTLFTRYGDVIGRAGWLYALSLAAILVLLWMIRKLGIR
jgi:apolipoprotein N-acyltransferase